MLPPVPGEGGVAIVAHASSSSFIEYPGVAPRGRLVLPTTAGYDPVGIVTDAVGQAHGRGGEGTKVKFMPISEFDIQIFLEIFLSSLQDGHESYTSFWRHWLSLLSLFNTAGGTYGMENGQTMKLAELQNWSQQNIVSNHHGHAVLPVKYQAGLPVGEDV